mgnify:CR=1 FL=1
MMKTNYLKNKQMKKLTFLSVLMLLFAPVIGFASEADLKIPDLSANQNNLLLFHMRAHQLVINCYT